MNEVKKQRITLNIAGEHIKTVINPNDEQQLRMVEKEVTKLWKHWRDGDPTKTSSQVLAMVAFQYAKLYYDEVAAGRAREAALMKFVKEYEERLNKIVLDV